jgi:hypothetical protein
MPRGGVIRPRQDGQQGGEASKRTANPEGTPGSAGGHGAVRGRPLLKRKVVRRPGTALQHEHEVDGGDGRPGEGPPTAAAGGAVQGAPPEGLPTTEVGIGHHTEQGTPGATTETQRARTRQEKRKAGAGGVQERQTKGPHGQETGSNSTAGERTTGGAAPTVPPTGPPTAAGTGRQTGGGQGSPTATAGPPSDGADRGQQKRKAGTGGVQLRRCNETLHQGGKRATGGAVLKVPPRGPPTAAGAGRQTGDGQGSPTATAGTTRAGAGARQEKRKAGAGGVQVRQNKEPQRQGAGSRSKQSKEATREEAAEARHRGRYHEPGD